MKEENFWNTDTSERRNYLNKKVAFLFAELDKELNGLNDLGMGEEGYYEGLIEPMRKLRKNWFPHE